MNQSIDNKNAANMPDAAVLYRKFNKEFTDLGSYWYHPFSPPDRLSNEKTGAQTMGKPLIMDGVMYPEEPLIDWFTYRKLLRDPTIALARCLMVAPMTLANFSLNVEEGAPKGAEELVQREILNRREYILKRGLEGCIDFGWIAFENVYNYDEKLKCVRLTKIKQLLHQITYLRANPYTGDFAGIMQDNIITGFRVYLPETKVQLFNIDMQGSNWYGNSILDNALRSARSWDTVEQLSMNHMRKAAGAHWVVWYPVGSTKINGIDKDNSEIASELLENLEANGGLALPQNMEDYRYVFENGGDKIWKVENMSDTGAVSSSFLEILRYYDVQKVRALMLPERSILEGEFGTKAEAVTHSESSVSGMEMRLRGLIRQLNEQTVRMLLRLNYGIEYENCVQIVCAPITHDDRNFMKELFNQLMSNQELGYAVAQGIDCNAIAKQLAIPQTEQQEEVLSDIGNTMQEAFKVGQAVKQVRRGNNTNSGDPSLGDATPDNNDNYPEYMMKG